MYKGKAKGMHS
ncbi:hypothetical protein EYZ11_004559 [Aspergillus tanneri]|uniref:Uncharacterized protein n=1 Tax=Aspergillus tanneri TaxID=1220188 RepID=A0A4S3JKJ9_9EURO|nr:hypothetical protein EYZ11_004559 [Aspergillus tanneri]